MRKLSFLVAAIMIAGSLSVFAGPKENKLVESVKAGDMKKVKDLKGRPLLLFVNEWSIRMTVDRNEGLKLTEFGRS